MEIRSLLLRAAPLSLLVGAMACTAEPHASAEVEAQTLPIVNGEAESGYPAVGSLVNSLFGVRLSFCTGTLIAPTWVVTAAHCVKGQAAPIVGFYVGEDGNGFGDTVYPAKELYFHPRYTDTENPAAILYDIGLVELSEPVPAEVATPYPYNRETLEDEVGREVTFVGYGATSAPAQQATGGGSKRRTTVEIDRVDDTTYSLLFEGTGVCFGDSGGPGLLDMDGETRVVSVVSTGNGCAGPDCDPCSEAGSNHTRVDAFADWIAGHLGDDFDRCNDDLSRCACPQACGEDGVCDNALCQVDSCDGMLSCLLDDCNQAMDGSCVQACVQLGSPAAQTLLGELITCWSEECPNLMGEEEDACVQEACPEQLSACAATAGPNLCDAVDRCAMECDDSSCVEACRLDGTVEAQAEQAALEECRSMECTDGEEDGLQLCAEASCETQFDACYPPEHCNPVGGACPDGTACVPSEERGNRCRPSEGTGEGEACDPDADSVPCADGLRCASTEEGDVCVQVCSTDRDCAGTCDLDADGGGDGLGLCEPPEEEPEVEMTTDPATASADGGGGGGCSLQSGGDSRGGLPVVMGLLIAACVRRRRRASGSAHPV